MFGKNKISIQSAVTVLVLCSLWNCGTHQSSVGLPGFEDFGFNLDSFEGEDDGEDVANVNEHSDVGTAHGLQFVKSSTIKAVAVLKGLKTYGIVRFVQINSGPTQISGFVAGLYPLGNHGIHVHEYKVEGGNCESAGSHYNPTQQRHGSPEQPMSHIGDLGNLQADAKGVARFDITSLKISLKGKFSVIERGLVVHRNTDDLGMGYNRKSLEDGNSGGRIACGTIKFVSIVKS